jgi:hypothetical protein
MKSPFNAANFTIIQTGNVFSAVALQNSQRHEPRNDAQIDCKNNLPCLSLFALIAKMDPRPRKYSVVHVGLMPLLVVSIFWALTLTVCPELHEWVHPDAGHEDHDCVVTLFSNGGVHFAAVNLLEIGKPSPWLFVDLLHLRSQVLVSAQTERLIPGRGPPRIE